MDFTANKMAVHPVSRESNQGMVYVSRANSVTNSYRVTQFIHLGSVGILSESLIDIHISDIDGFWRITFDLKNNKKTTRDIAPSVNFPFLKSKDNRTQCQGTMRITEFSKYDELWKERMDWGLKMDSSSMEQPVKNDNLRNFRIWKSSYLMQFPVSPAVVVVAVEFQIEFCNIEKRQLTLGPHTFLSIGCRMFDAMEFTDFKLKVGSTEFKVHKCVLAAGSSVFKAMFQSEMQESSLGIAEIVLDELALREMLRFMYTAEVSLDALQSTWSEMVHAADMYDVPALKGLCGNEVIKMLSKENAVSTLVQADRYSMKVLKCECLKFIVLHLSDIMRGGQWRKFEQSHGTLVSDILKTVPKYLAVQDNSKDISQLLSSDSEDGL